MTEDIWDRSYVFTGFYLYLRFGGWLVLPIVVVSHPDPTGVLAVSLTVIAFSFEAGRDYIENMGPYRPARLHEVFLHPFRR